MGAWGAGTFENDDAGDWTWELDDVNDHTILEETLAIVADAEGQPESPDACNALAAAEVVAALKGRPLEGRLPDSVEKYLQRVKTPPSAELTQLAVRTIDRIKKDSELKDLWEETDLYEEWKSIVEELKARLQN